jgi:hypothetical protein
MKSLLSAMLLPLVFTAVPALAEKPDTSSPRPPSSISIGQVSPTPEMWFYEQYMLNYENPQMAVRERAHFQAMQRESRIASRQWYGFSNARPRAGADPIHGDYGPSWTSGNGYHPLRWRAAPAATVILRPQTY